jgi:transposase
MSDRVDHTFKHTLESKPDEGGDDGVRSVRRIELITGTGRRRRWSDDDKARIVVESLRPGANV